MNDNAKLLALHAACVALILACLVLSVTLFKGVPGAPQLLVGLAAFLWGALGFKPAPPVLARLLSQMAPEEVARLTSRPPGPRPAAEPTAPVPPPPLGKVD